MEWQPRLVRERGDFCTNTRKRPTLGKASRGADRNSELKQGLRCDCGQMASNTAGRPRLSGGQCWSDEALLYQVRRNGEAGTRMTKIKVCVSCRAMWAGSTAMKCSLEKRPLDQQQSVETLITRSVSESACSSQLVIAIVPRIACLHRCQAPRREVGKKRTGTFLSRTSSLLRLALRVSVKSILAP